MKDITRLLLSGLALMNFDILAQGELPDSVYAIAYNRGNSMSIMARPDYNSDLIDICRSRDTLELIEYYGDFYIKVSRLNSNAKGYLHIKFLAHDKHAVDLINSIAKKQGYPARLIYSPLPPPIEMSNDKASNSMAGEYWVLVDNYNGIAKEKFILNTGGSVIWEYISQSVIEKKYGTWELKNSGMQIYISIKGNSGQIEEIYDLKNGKFRSGDRYLKRYKAF